MKLLFIHPVFPGQHHQLMAHLAKDPANTVVHLGKQKGLTSVPGVRSVLYRLAPHATQQAPPVLRKLEDAVWEAQAVVDALKQLAHDGFVPDVIYGYAGWGPTMFLKDFYPNVPYIGYFEWYLNACGFEYDFDPAFALTEENRHCIHLQNAPFLLDLNLCDAGTTPTHWQKQAFPSAFHNKLHVIHDGVDTDFYTPNPLANLVLPQLNLDLSGIPEIVTYTTRGMEPFRGFPQAMAAIVKILKARPQCHAVIAGTDNTFYSKKPAEGETYKQNVLNELDIHDDRVHFTGWLSMQQYRLILQASSAHIYLTYPYVLSWSMLEAMACGALLIGSRTPPVEEVIRHGDNGLLVDFFDSDELAETVCSALAQPNAMRPLRQAARYTIMKDFSLQAVMPRHLALLKDISKTSALMV